MNFKVLKQGIVVSILAVAAVSSEAVTLTKDGQPKAVVVIPEKPRPVEKFAAEEFVKFVKRASGATLKVVHKPVEGLDTVFIGRSVKIDAWCGAYGYEPNGGSVNVTDHALELVGGDNDDQVWRSDMDAGSLFAVYEFLERELRLRWLWPDEEIGIVVRPQPTIEVSPKSYGFRTICSRQIGLRAMPRLWALRTARAHDQHSAMPPEVNGGHVFGRWWKTYGKAHPDFFEMNKNGERVVGGGSSMCVSNPEFEAELVRIWRRAKAANPAFRYGMNLGENDTDGRCMCPRCRSWDDPDAPKGNVSERYCRHYLNVCRELMKDDPNVCVFANAYNNYNFGPKGFKLVPNINICFVPDPKVPYTKEWRETVRRQAKSWRDSGCTFNYRPNLLDGYVMPFDISDDIYDEFHQVYDGGTMVSYDVDGPNCSFATQGPFLYMLSRLAVHPDQPLEEIRAEWFDGFGPAADAIRGYFDYWRKYIHENAELFCRVPCEHDPISHQMFFGWHFAFYAHLLYPPEVFPPAEKLIAEARAAAKDSPDDLGRVEFVAAGLEHAKVCAATCAVFADKAATTEERLAAFDRVQAVRAKLPPLAVNLRNCTENMHNEAVAWVLPSMDPKRSVALPIDWKFHLDTEDRGESLGYQKADFDDSKWGTAKTDRHLERQGYKSGWLHAWFRLETTVPEKFRGARKTVFHFGALDKTCHMWINGQPAGKFLFNPATHPNSWNLPMEFDITKLVPADGKLSIAVKVTSEVGAGGIVKPCYLIFPDSKAERAGFDPQNPPDFKNCYSFGTVCCNWEDGVMRFTSGEGKRTAAYRLDQLTSPSDKCLRTAVEYRKTGSGRVALVIEERNMNNRVTCRSPLVLETSGTFRPSVLDVNVKSDTVRLEIRIENELKPGETAEIRSLQCELLSLLAH